LVIAGGETVVSGVLSLVVDMRSLATDWESLVEAAPERRLYCLELMMKEGRSVTYLSSDLVLYGLTFEAVAQDLFEREKMLEDL
jgi:hypothetical protein